MFSIIDPRAARPIEIVIARCTNWWLPAPLHTARIYTDGLVRGAIMPVTDASEWQHVPTTLGHRIYEPHTSSGLIDASEWQTGINAIHGLAHGVLECAETGERYGAETDLAKAWFLYPDDVEGTGLTMNDVSATFSGDVVATARAFLRACALRPIP